MAFGFQVTFDAHDPEALGLFWARLLGYRPQPPPDGYASWDEALAAMGVPEDQRDTAYAVVDPDGAGPRLFFQKVPEGKTAKNRVHLDVNTGVGLEGADRRAKVDAEAERAIGLGASRTGLLDGALGYCHVMRDPEGNEFCVQ